LQSCVALVLVPRPDASMSGRDCDMSGVPLGWPPSSEGGESPQPTLNANSTATNDPIRVVLFISPSLSLGCFAGNNDRFCHAGPAASIATACL
jgi:hypothetical protein